jgi:phosphoribosylformylglycinamidine synthase
MPETTVNSEIAIKLGLSSDEFEHLITSLGRIPNFVELAIISVLWTDKKLNKNIFDLLKRQPAPAYQILCQINNNQHSIIDINENTACIIKFESSNLSFASDPYIQSANCITNASRTILSAGATPLAGINAFRLGLPEKEQTKKIYRGFIQGIGEIGNASGYPIVGSKICFENCFDARPELNSLIVGLIEKQNSADIGINYLNHKIYIIGDEIKKETSPRIKINSKEDLDDLKINNYLHDQAGFYEKILHESISEAIQTGAAIAIKSIDNSGIITSLSELSSFTNTGIQIELNKVIADKSTDQILNFLFSGQQAKLLLVVDKGKEKILEKIFGKWEISFTEIGKTIDEKKLIFKNKSETVAELPLEIFLAPIVQESKEWAKEELKKLKKAAESGLENIPMPENLKEVAWFLIKHPNIASKNWIHEQYDSMAGIGNLSTNFISDSILINLKATNTALALCISGNHKHIQANASIGTQIAIATAVRKIVCTGAKPLAVIPAISYVNSLKSADTDKLKELIQGINEACSRLKLPIANEKIRLNDYPDIEQDVSHCPGLSIGMIGILENKNHQMTISFKNKGNIIFLIGPSKEDISASEYLVSYHKQNSSTPPFFNLDMECKVQETIQELISKNYVCSVHNVSRGGLFISLVESAMINGYGFDIITDTDIRLDAFLFGESQGRVLVSINPNKEGNFIDLMMKKEIPFLALGHVTKGEMRVDDISFGFISDAKKAYENALERIIK